MSLYLFQSPARKKRKARLESWMIFIVDGDDHDADMRHIIGFAVLGRCNSITNPSYDCNEV